MAKPWNTLMAMRNSKAVLAATGINMVEAARVAKPPNMQFLIPSLHDRKVSSIYNIRKCPK